MTELKDIIYRTDRRLEKYEIQLADSKIDEETKSLFRKFINSRVAAGLSKARTTMIYQAFKILGQCAVSPLIKDTTRGDIEQLMLNIRKKNHAPMTIELYKETLKQYYRWLFELESRDRLPDAVRWIKGVSPPSNIKRESLLTEEEVEKLADSTNNLMYRAMIFVLYESAVRPLELLTMRIGDVTFEESHAKIYVRGKMEKKQGDREIFLFKSYDILRSWLDSHPFKHDKTHTLWIVQKGYAEYGLPITVHSLGCQIKHLTKKAGINKKITPYTFRHSRAVVLYKTLGEALAKKFMGHTPDSSMARFYNHLNATDLLESLSTLHGIRPKEEIIDKTICHRCHHQNGYGAINCSQCGLALSLNAVIKTEVEREDMIDKFNKLSKFADMVEASPDIMRILESKEWQDKQMKRI